MISVVISVIRVISVNRRTAMGRVCHVPSLPFAELSLNLVFYRVRYGAVHTFSYNTRNEQGPCGTYVDDSSIFRLCLGD